MKPIEGSIFYLEDKFNKPITLNLPLDPGIWLKKLITGEYDPLNVDFFYNRPLQKQSAQVTMVNMGTNIDLFSRQCVSIFNSRLVSIYSYEPDLEIFLSLQKICQTIIRKI